MAAGGSRVGTRSVVCADVDEERARAAIELHNGTVVKSADAGGMVATFASAADASAAAVAAQQVLHHLGIDARIGISVGDVATDDAGNVAGAPVIEAARLCATALPTEILAAQTVRELARGRGALTYESMGDVELAGEPAGSGGRTEPEPVSVCRIAWAPVPERAATVPFPNGLVGGFTTSYVGRTALLDRLTEQWRAAEAGTAGAVLLAGEPGVGKTRTVAELARLAHADGALVLYGRCDEDLRAPYQPFIEALDAYTAGDTVGPLGRLPGELLRLLPKLSERVADLPAPVPSDPGSEVHRLFEGATSWLIDAARETGLVLVLDDVHWATKPTLLLALHLLRGASAVGAPLLVVVTYRDTDISRTHPLAGVLAEMRQLPGVERSPVENLSEAEVLALMEATAGHPMGRDGRALGTAVFAETEGNPFFVSEVLRHLIETGAVRRAGDGWVATGDLTTVAIPEGVRDVVGRRLSRLSANANGVLTLAAVQGREVDIDVLSALTEDELAVLDALDEAVGARLVEETGAGRFRFSHALVRTTLYDELTATRRRRMHRRVANALEKLRPLDVVALAHHFAEGGPENGDLDRALQYGLAAAEQSLASRAFADAEERFRQVLEMLDDVDQTPPSIRVAALCGLGESQRDQGDREFRDTLLEAARLAHELRETALLVRAVVSNSRGVASIVGAVDAERIELIEAALDAVGDVPSADRARLLAQLSAEVTYAGDNARRLSLCDEAEDMARGLGDDAVLAWVLVRTGYSAVAPSRSEQWIARGEEAVRLTEATGDPSLRVLSRIFYYGALLFAGRMTEAFALGDELLEIADTECSPSQRWLAHVNTLPSWFGREGVVAAGERNDATLLLGQDANEPDALQWWGAAASSAYRLRGEGADVADTAGMFAAQYPGLQVWYTGYGWMLCEGDRHDEARAMIEAQGLRFETMEDGSLPLCGTHQLAAVAWELDDVEMAANLVPVLEKYVGRWSHYFLVPLGPVEWGLGAALSVLGETDRAVALVEEAVTKLVDNGFRDHAVHCRIHLARILLRADRPGDRERAREVLLEARAHADSIPAPRLVAKIDALLP